MIEGSLPEERDKSHVVRDFTILWINEVSPGHVDEYLEASKQALPYYPRYGVDVLGCWIGGIGAKSNEVIFLINYHDLDTYNRLYSAPEFVELHTSLDVQRLRSNTGWLLNPVDLSPLELPLIADRSQKEER